MPLENFAPTTAAGVDSAKVYLIKGDTLKQLLVRVECNLSQFDVEESPSRRVYTLKPGSDATGSDGSKGLSFNIYVRDVQVMASYDPGTGVTTTTVMEAVEPLKLCVRNGLITADEATDDGYDDIYTYSFIGRIRGDSTDSGEIRYDPGTAPF